MFIDRYKPSKMEELIIHPKKIQEFNEFMQSANKKILILQGSSG